MLIGREYSGTLGSKTSEVCGEEGKKGYSGQKQFTQYAASWLA
jgi:hypothetical protein